MKKKEKPFKIFLYTTQTVYTYMSKKFYKNLAEVVLRCDIKEGLQNMMDIETFQYVCVLQEREIGVIERSFRQ